MLSTGSVEPMSFFLSMFSQIKLDSDRRYIRVLILVLEEGSCYPKGKKRLNMIRWDKDRRLALKSRVVPRHGS